MTTEPDLLTLPDELQGRGKSGAIKDYARANVEYHTAAQAAEIEALRAEVERLKSMTAVTMGVGRGDGSLFVHGDYDSIKAAQALVFRAERLAEALREAADMLLADYPETAKRLRAALSPPGLAEGEVR